jgi:flagellar motility protein MotE (MotC chaperone)
VKYFLQLALVAMTLFSVSAALSLWLNQSQQTAEKKDAEEKAAKRPGKDTEPPADKDKEKPPRPASKLPDVSLPGAGPTEAMAAVREREDRLDRRQAQVDLILRDLQAERNAVDALMRQVTDETKKAAARAAEEATAPAQPLPKKDTLDPATEQKNIGQLVRLYDAMPAESAAPILKQMADSGRMDTAVQILAQMKDRQAAQVLAAFGDTALAGQITDRIRLLRRAAPAGAGSNVAPAGGAPRP